MSSAMIVGTTHTQQQAPSDGLHRGAGGGVVIAGDHKGMLVRESGRRRWVGARGVAHTQAFTRHGHVREKQQHSKRVHVTRSHSGLHKRHLLQPQTICIAHRAAAVHTRVHSPPVCCMWVDTAGAGAATGAVALTGLGAGFSGPGLAPWISSAALFTSSGCARMYSSTSCTCNTGSDVFYRVLITPNPAPT